MREVQSIEERTYRFAVTLVRAFRQSCKGDVADQIMWQQLLKAGTSVGANSAESPGAQSRRDWLTRRYIALKEAREAQFWLRLLKDAGSTGRIELEELLQESGEIVAILTAVVRTATSNATKKQS